MNVRNAIYASLLVTIFAGAPVLSAAEADAPPESVQNDVTIPFANQGGVYDWKADRDRGLWIQDVHGQWYYAKLMSPCTGLNFANTIAFDTHPMGNFDRFSAIIVPHRGRCVVQSLRLSGAPPGKSVARPVK